MNMRKKGFGMITKIACGSCSLLFTVNANRVKAANLKTIVVLRQAKTEPFEEIRN